MKSPERVLVIGNGGREHAIAWKLHQSPRVGELFVAPGNGGTREVATNIDIDPTDISRLESFAKDCHIGFTVVGPESSLAAGVVDAFTQASLPIFGPTQAAARLETDKVFSSEFMQRHAIPHPDYFVPTSPEEAMTYMEKKDPQNCVIKAKGLAQGKGVVIPRTTQEAMDTIVAMMQKNLFGDAGKEVVIQERVFGREISAFALCDGVHAVPLVVVQDHKRVFDGDCGPNTGGMGAYAPVPFVTPEMLKEIHHTILQPTVDGMREEGTPYRGMLYAGLMLTKDGILVLEYNCRFGDPETQPLMMLLSSDLLQHLAASAAGHGDKEYIQFRSGFAVCVVVSSEGYPGTYAKGHEIRIAHSVDPHIALFHAGTLMRNGRLVTNGGRVVGITAYGNSLEEAIDNVYQHLYGGIVTFDGMHYRNDIAKQGLNP